MRSVDKYEFRIKLEQIQKLKDKEDYQAAAAIADTIDWRKAKSVSELCNISDIYEKIGKYEESKEILMIAYDRSPLGRMIVYRLAENAINLGNYQEAKEYYEDFIEVAPRDSMKYVLRYKIGKGTEKSLSELIVILERLRDTEYSDEWAYELASLYHKAGMVQACVQECNDIILWFGEGKYVQKAMELKMIYEPLTPEQVSKFQNKKSVENLYEMNKKAGDILQEKSEGKIKNISPDRFHTVNLQAELAKEMEQIMHATKAVTVSSSMNHIKMLVDGSNIPELQKTQEIWKQREEKEAQEKAQQGEKALVKIEKAQEYKKIGPKNMQKNKDTDTSLNMDFRELLAEDTDGQISLYVPEEPMVEKQITGQMSIEDILAEWEKTKKAAEEAIAVAEKRRLEEAKNKALRQAEDIMDCLTDYIPQIEDVHMTEESKLDHSENSKEEETVLNLAHKISDGIEQPEDLQENKDIWEDEATLEITIKLPLEELGGESVITDTGEETNEINQETIEKTEALKETKEDKISEEELTKDDKLEEKLIKNQQEDVIQMKEDNQNVESLFTSKEKAEETFVDDYFEENYKKKSKKQKKASRSKKERNEKNRLKERQSELTEEQRKIFTYFSHVREMEEQLCGVLNNVQKYRLQDTTSNGGNILISGESGMGKTTLATDIVKAIQKDKNENTGKVGKVKGAVINKKDIEDTFKKMRGGYLIVEKAGDLESETLRKMVAAMEQDTNNLLVIMEDDEDSLKYLLGLNKRFADKFTEKIKIPILNNDELVAFGRAYANELAYDLDEMGTLALYNRIGCIEKLDVATTLIEVKEIVDEAISSAEKGGVKKLADILFSRRYNEEDYVILREKDFEK